MELFSKHSKQIPVENYQEYIKSLHKFCIGPFNNHQNNIARFSFSGSTRKFKLKRFRENGANYMIPSILGSYDESEKLLTIELSYKRAINYSLIPIAFILFISFIIHNLLLGIIVFVSYSILISFVGYFYVKKQKEVLLNEAHTLSKLPGVKNK